MICINTFDDLHFDRVLFGKCRNWLLVISQEKDIVHIFTNTDERWLKRMMKDLIKKRKGQE